MRPLSPPRAPCCSWCRLGPDRTLFTGREQGLVRWLPGRPALLVSSTSWTLDEDFGILLEALQLYDFQVRLVQASLPSRAGGGWPERLPAVYRRRVGLDSAAVGCSLCLAWLCKKWAGLLRLDGSGEGVVRVETAMLDQCVSPPFS